MEYMGMTGLSGMSGIVGGEDVPPPPDVYIIILAGESNSGGVAPNASLTPAELAARNLLIWNSVAGAWQALDIGTNNNTGHGELTNSTHGLENALANYFDDGVFGAHDVRLLKAGNGGSDILQWVGGSETLFTRMVGRTDAAVTALSGQSVRFLFWWSQGINDSDGTYTPAMDATTWKSHTQSFFAAVRAEYGATVPIVCTQLPAAFTAYNAALAEIAAADSRTFIASSSGATQVDGYHWDANGFKTLCPRMLAPFFNQDVNLRQLGPVISSQPSDASVVEGNDADFSVSTESLTSVVYQWQKSDDGIAFSDVAGETSADLSVVSVTVADDDADVYRVRATALGKTRTSRHAVLTVQEPTPYSPDDNAKLIGWFRSDYGVYQDTGGTTTPATATDHNVNTWVCKLASGNLQITDGWTLETNRFRLKPNYVGSYAGIYKGTGTTSNRGLRSTVSYSVKSAVVVAKHDGATTSGQPTLWSATASANPSLIASANGTTNFFKNTGFTDGWTYRKNGSAVDPYAMPMNEIAIIELHKSTAASINFMIGEHQLGPTSYPWKGWYFEILLYNDELTTQERTDLNTYLSGRYGITL